MSALDAILNPAAWSDSTLGAIGRYALPQDVDAARAELAALRQRCEDAELIARAAIDPRGGVLPLDTPSSRWHLRAKGRSFVLHDDGTGLPALTDEARKALRGGA